MTIQSRASQLPLPDLGRLRALSPAELALAFIGSQKTSPDSATAEKALGIFGNASLALAEAIGRGLIYEQDGYYFASEGSQRLADRASWPDAKRALALQALGAASGSGKRGDLVAVALRQLYALDDLPSAPSRQQVRCELLACILAALVKPSEFVVTRPATAYKFDALSRHLYLAFAGLKSGSVLQADFALLSSAFGTPISTVADLSATIIRAALRPAAEEAPAQELPFDLEGFAISVRGLAQRLETKPYAGRVAIAQVYDAGLEIGLNLGTLDDFKAHLAEAAREGLLDLERYDITGPLDAALKERSRLRLGRDERHFIVNQWI